MNSDSRWFGFVFLSWVAFGSVVHAENRRVAPRFSAEPQHRVVEFFDAMNSGDIEVRYIPGDETRGRMFVANRAGEPLSVSMPGTFAAVPILAQNNSVFPPLSQQTQNNQGSQTVGGPSGTGFPWQNNGGGQNQNFFNNIPADSVAEIRVPTVCLEHGKGAPRPLIPYKVVKLESVCDDPALAATLVKLGQGEIDNRTAQAVAWHLANEMNWEDLKEEPGDIVAIGVHKPLFSKKQLERAEQIVNQLREQQRAGEYVAKKL